MNNNGKKLFVVRKYILARDAVQAIKLEKTTKVDDVFIDPEWKESQARQLPPAIGFSNE